MQADTFEIPDDTMEHGVRLFSVLSSEDAVRIFLYAEKGIASSTKAIKDLGITQKRYYSRLKGLIDVGLIEKVDGVYMYSAVGKIVHRLGFYLIAVLNNVDRIKLLTNLTKTELLSSSEMYRIARIISEQSGELGGLLDTITDKKLNNIEVFNTFEKLVEKLVEQIDLSQNSVLLATRYLDVRAMNAGLKAIDRGITLRSLFSKEKLSGKLNKFKLLLSPKNIMGLLTFLNSSINMSETIREVNLPFSFVIIDNSICFFELPTVGSKYSIAFYINDEATAKRFTELFNQLWEMGDIQEWLDLKRKLKSK